ncbi:MAG TPA: hypothetical protein DEF33_08290 [Clostridiales bacterium]|nr:hypothetical protein [Clostridiales bacterium]
MIKRKLLSGGFKKANAVICPFPPCLFACLRWLIFAWFVPMLSIIFVRRHSGSLDLRCSAPVPSVFVILRAQHHYYFIICELKAASVKIIVEFTLFARKQLCPGAESVIYGLSAILRAAVRQNTPGSFQRKTLDKHRDM